MWLDLCCGLGGASQPALDRGWRVIRVDIDPQFKPDIVADIRNLPLKPLDIDVLWASPPCIEFSKWSLPASWACNGGRKRPPSLDLVLAVRDAIARFQSRQWIVENVAGARPFLTSVFGPVRAITGGHVFWSNRLLLLPQVRGHKWRVAPGPNRAALRARIPYEIGEAICIAVER